MFDEEFEVVKNKLPGMLKKVKEQKSKKVKK